MTAFCRVAIVAVLALAATELTCAQDFSQFSAGPQAADEVTSAVYASLSDVQGPEYAETQVVFESLSDSVPSLATTWMSDDGVVAIPGESTSVISNLPVEIDDEGAGQTSLFGSSCGLPSGCDACGEIACGSLCTPRCPTCCGVGKHYSRVYGELLYLRARNAEVAYAVGSDGPVAAGAIPIQVGGIGIVDPDYELGFRAGANIALNTVSSIDVRYTMFESLTHDQLSQTASFFVQSLVTHPSTGSAADDVLSSDASLEVDFDFIDASYRHLLKCCDLFSANYVLGARYAQLEQQFDVEFIKNGLETVSTDIDFDGAGMRLGLEAERYSCCNRLQLYANGYASFLAGRFRAQYFQGDSFDQSVVDAEWEAGRIVPILDLECGVGWTCKSGKLRLKAGYMVSAWFNSVTSQDYINAIQRNDFLGLSDTITFDGLQARFEFSF